MIWAEAVCVGCAVEAAVTVTTVPEGSDVLGVKVAALPLAVCAGEKEPQLVIPVTVQETYQSMPSPVWSPEREAVMPIGKFNPIALGGAGVKLTDTPPASSM